MTKEDKPDVGRLLATKDHDYPFYFDGHSFRAINGVVDFEEIRCDGDYFDQPVFIDVDHIKKVNPEIFESELFWRRLSLDELKRAGVELKDKKSDSV